METWPFARRINYTAWCSVYLGLSLVPRLSLLRSLGMGLLRTYVVVTLLMKSFSELCDLLPHLNCIPCSPQEWSWLSLSRHLGTSRCGVGCLGWHMQPLTVSQRWEAAVPLHGSHQCCSRGHDQTESLPSPEESQHTKCNVKYVSVLVLYPGTVRPTLPGNETSVCLYTNQP